MKLTKLIIILVSCVIGINAISSDNATIPKQEESFLTYLDHELQLAREEAKKATAQQQQLALQEKQQAS